MGCRWQKKKLTRVMTLPYFTQNEKNVAYTSTLKISHSIQNKNKKILRSKIYLKCCHTSYSQNDRCTLGNEMKTRRIRHCWSNGEWVTKKKKHDCYTYVLWDMVLWQILSEYLCSEKVGIILKKKFLFFSSLGKESEGCTLPCEIICYICSSKSHSTCSCSTITWRFPVSALCSRQSGNPHRPLWDHHFIGCIDESRNG